MTVSKDIKPSRIRDCYQAVRQTGNQRTPRGYTWHHDGANPGTLQLVETGVHNAFPHSGGVTVIRGQIEND